MSVRAVWVIQDLDGGGNGDLLYSKRFPTVERRAGLCCGQLYHALPSDRELCREVMASCQLSLPEVHTGQQVSSSTNWPIYELFKGKLWPVVCLRQSPLQNQMMFVAVVLFDTSYRPSLPNIPGIPAAIALLSGMAEVLGSTPPTDKTAAGMELHHYVSLSSPFGSLVDSNPSNTRLQLQYWKAASMPKEKIPAWRPAVYKGSSRLQLHIREEISGVQYDRDDINDVWRVYGSLTARAEMDGHPDVLISLNTPAGHAHLNHLTVHPSVQSADNVPYSSDGMAQIRKLRFSGLMDTFTLCSYQATVPAIPIRGFYQMKGDKVVELLVQLKLLENVRNSFDHFEVHLPFYNRGPIDHVENIVPSSASVAIVTSRKKLIWSVPQRLPAKTLEVSLRATVVFLEYPQDSEQEDHDEGDEEEELLKRFCVDQNAYCEVHFSISDYTLSGCSIDQQSITTFPPVKHKTVVSRELVASSYRIWNSHGDVLCFPTTEG